jgi:hypothetical protein
LTIESRSSVIGATGELDDALTPVTKRPQVEEDDYYALLVESGSSGSSSSYDFSDRQNWSTRPSGASLDASLYSVDTEEGSNSMIDDKQLRAPLAPLLQLLRHEDLAFLVLPRLCLHEWFILQRTCSNMADALPTELMRQVARETPWPLSNMQMQEKILGGTCDLDILFIYLERVRAPQSHFVQLLDVVNRRVWPAGSRLLVHKIRQEDSTFEERRIAHEPSRSSHFLGGIFWWLE